MKIFQFWRQNYGYILFSRSSLRHLKFNLYLWSITWDKKKYVELPSKLEINLRWCAGRNLFLYDMTYFLKKKKQMIHPIISAVNF